MKMIKDNTSQVDKDEVDGVVHPRCNIIFVLNFQNNFIMKVQQSHVPYRVVPGLPNALQHKRPFNSILQKCGHYVQVSPDMSALGLLNETPTRCIRK